MSTINLKLVVTIMIIALFTSCKTSSEAEKSKGNSSQRNKGGQPSVEQLISEMDSDKDGKLSETEVKGPLKNDFSKIDTDDDGFLTDEELEAAPKPERQGQGRPQR